MFKNWNFISLAISFGIINGVFNLYGSVIGDILDPYGLHSDDVSVFGAIHIIIGIIGDFFCGLMLKEH